VGDVGAEWAWAIPALSASAFVLTALFGRWLPGRGAFIPIGAIAGGFALFWFVLADVITNGPTTVDLNWITLGDTTISW